MEDRKEMSLPEKGVLCTILQKGEPLDYPMKEMQIEREGYSPEQEYIIPEEDREAVLKMLYPFVNPPSITDRLYDLHEGKWFTVGEYRVIRHEGRDMLVSPYYPHSGGMVIDWIENPDCVNSPDCATVSIKEVNREAMSSHENE